MEFCHLEDSLERINLNMSDKIYIFDNIEDSLFYLKKESETNLLCEVCGLLGQTKDGKFIYKRMQNRSKDPASYFIVDPYDYLKFIKDYFAVAIFHSHIAGDEKASEFDEKTSENCCLPFIIYSINTEKFFIYEPQYKDYDVNHINRLKVKI